MERKGPRLCEAYTLELSGSTVAPGIGLHEHHETISTLHCKYAQILLSSNELLFCLRVVQETTLNWGA